MTRTRVRREGRFFLVLARLVPSSIGESLDALETWMARIEFGVFGFGIILFAGLMGELGSEALVWELLVAIGVGGEVAGGFAHAVLGARHRIVATHKERTQELEIERLKKETADANRRALEAHAKLVPQYLFPERRPALIEALTPYAGQLAVVFLDFDLFRSGQFAIDVQDALEKAGWEASFDDVTRLKPSKPYANHGVIIETLRYEGRDPTVQAAAQALEHALSAYGYEDIMWFGRDVQPPPKDASEEILAECRTIRVFPPDFR